MEHDRDVHQAPAGHSEEEVRRQGPREIGPRTYSHAVRRCNQELDREGGSIPGGYS